MKANKPCINSCLLQVPHKVLITKVKGSSLAARELVSIINFVLVTRTSKQRTSILEVADNVFNAGGRLLPFKQYCQGSHYHRTWISCHIFCRLIREKWSHPKVWKLVSVQSVGCKFQRKDRKSPLFSRDHQREWMRPATKCENALEKALE